MIYIGTDSQQYFKHVKFLTVVVIHTKDVTQITFFRSEINGNMSTNHRLNKEVELTVSKWVEMGQPMECELHFDLNPNPKHKSNHVYKQTKGSYGFMTNYPSKFKPEAWAATAVADHFCRK